MNHKKCEKIREIGGAEGIQPEFLGRSAFLVIHGISFQAPNRWTRQPRSIPAKARNRITRLALCGGDLEMTPR